MSLRGKTAIVTGGGRGIGGAICIELARLGASVVVNYSGSESAAEDVAQICREVGGAALTCRADVSKADEVEAMFAACVAEYGRVDILVNNAGVTRDGLIVRMSEDDFDRVVSVNLKGAFLCMKQAGKIMMKQRAGRIINISSVVGVTGNAGQVNYAASKAGVIGMTKSLAKELAPRNVTVNAVAPGFIATDMTAALSEAVTEKLKTMIPLARLGVPQDVAGVVAFLAGDAASYITGQTIHIDGGMAI